MNLAPWASFLTWVATGMTVVTAITSCFALYARSQAGQQEREAFAKFKQEATAATDREHKARVELEAKLADRVLTAEQQRRITAAVTPLRGQTIEVAMFGSTMEIARLTESLRQSLREAGVLVTSFDAMSGAAQGVLVGVNRGADAATRSAVTQIVGIMREGFEVTECPWEDLAPNQLATVRVPAGAVPLGSAQIRIAVGAK